jgi:hypothetical protein
MCGTGGVVVFEILLRCKDRHHTDGISLRTLVFERSSSCKGDDIWLAILGMRLVSDDAPTVVKPTFFAFGGMSLYWSSSFC